MKTIIIILLIVLLVGVVGGVISIDNLFDNVTQTTESDFYLKIFGDVVFKDVDYTMPYTEADALVVEVCVSTADLSKYVVNIVQAEGMDFEYSVGSRVYNFKNIQTNFNSAFNIINTYKGFNIYAKSSHVEELIEIATGSDAVKLNIDDIDKNKPLFSVYVTTADNSHACMFNLCLDASTIVKEENKDVT